MASKTTKTASPDGLEKAFLQWKTMAELQLELIEKLGVYKLETAKSELVRAVAAGQWAVARMKAQVARELEAALRRIRRLRGQTRRRVRRIDQQARDIAKIRSGEQLPLGQLTRMWAAYTVFERLTPMTTLETIINTPLHPTARQGGSYVNVRDPNTPCPDPPQTVDNVHSLISWVKRHRYMPKRGTQAYRQLVSAFAQIATVAEIQIQAIEKTLEAIEQRTHEVWQPLAIAALPDSIDVKKIIRIGTR